MTTGRVRQLTPDDTDEILRIVNLEGLDAVALTRELASGDDYLWMGVSTPAGPLGAVHRSLRWENYLLLKGVFVAAPLQGGGAALELAFALRNVARERGFAGVAAWVEPHKPEAGLARMLRLRPNGPLVHRFETAVPDEGPSVTVPARGSGMLTTGLSAEGSVLVEDLLGSGPPGSVRWVHDRHRLVLRGFPAKSIAQLDQVLTAVEPTARAKRTRFVEFPVPAADVGAALALASVKARRLSRTPVRLERLDFTRTNSRGTDRVEGRPTTHGAV